MTVSTEVDSTILSSCAKRVKEKAQNRKRKKNDFFMIRLIKLIK